MAYRSPTALLPLERRVLECAVTHAAEGVYGFALAQELATDQGDRRLVAHGTLYKALDRLRRRGLLESRWEDAEVAAAEGRPRRRIYLITAQGRVAAEPSPAGDGVALGGSPA
jgi:PadR family transcriptional regulator, regulatory protein PadR